MMIEGREGLVQPTEKSDYDAALKVFRDGDYKGAQASFQSFARRYPNSVYLPLATFWSGNAAYALKDYKTAISIMQDMIKVYSDHPKVA
ncbi:MAG: outer membrane protein assembly factor BamD [Candidatus Protistobacter heckmanni]|nr:outer membrane protein assembly factor BamD [Candidatus Protistobacter heckmanni]